MTLYLWVNPGTNLFLCSQALLIKSEVNPIYNVPFFSTDLKNTLVQIIEWFVLRWNIEVTFQESRSNLGVETQRQWSDNAIQRATSLLMAMYSILTLIALKMNTIKALVVQETTSWYDKQGLLILL